MNDYNASINYQCESGILGNSIDIYIDPDSSNSEIRADISVSKYDNIRIWGQVKNCKNHIISGALIKLVKVNTNSNEKNLECIAHTISDYNGFYQFDICGDTPNICYKIIVSKSNTGSKKILDNYNKNCQLCNKNKNRVSNDNYSNPSYISPKNGKNLNILYNSSYINSSYTPSIEHQNKSSDYLNISTSYNCEKHYFHDTKYKKYILCK